MPATRSRKATSPKGSSSKEGGPSFLTVARIRRPFGVRGELLLEILTEFPQRLQQAETLFVGPDRTERAVESIRRHGEDMLLRLDAVGDRDAAEKLRGAELSIRFDDLPPLPAGVYYHHQIEGLRVMTEAGETLGRVTEILKTGANDVYVVAGERGEILLPAIPQVILQIRPEQGEMVVRLMDGLIA